jgi:hypothetical protein
MWDLWWTKCHWDSFFCQYFDCCLSLTFYVFKDQPEDDPTNWAETCSCNYNLIKYKVVYDYIIYFLLYFILYSTSAG